VISEEQLYVNLHFFTIFSAYDNFQQGVIHSEKQGEISGVDQEKYVAMYEDYLRYKNENVGQTNYKKHVEERIKGL
jgi:hypothetical protein